MSDELLTETEPEILAATPLVTDVVDADAPEDAECGPRDRRSRISSPTPIST
jgi:hypothetical protein